MRGTPVTGHPFLDQVHQPPGRILAFAHRGGADHPQLKGLENTMAAFRHAVELGYRHLETDVHATADGVLLAFHDASLDRVTDRTGRLAELTYDVVREARIFGTEPIPTLTELVEAFPAVSFNIDVKATTAVAPLAAFIEERQLWERVLVGSFSGARLAAFRRLTRGRVPTSAHSLEVLAFRFLPSGRLADLVTGGRVDCLQIPHRHRGLTVATPGLVRRAHAAGKHVHVWTIDDPEEMVALAERGVDGLMTDRTDLLKQVLESRGQW
ncbi:glycerophosphodiester phosphodiesterase [Nocardioides limicola]|uniref:glycerophosphodiester phosphodiesterase n=1 Tax=Nocardioides limicola TaxID=2803368 RepID=UPI00193C649C|nr:glycerophosphodiester phosphodiesterase [Nocardioides sp. DJM-14]